MKAAALDLLSGASAMTSSGNAEAALALHRFGMGPKPGSIVAIASDPRGALLAELERFPAEFAAASELPSSARACRADKEANAKRQAKATLAKKAQDEARKVAMAGAMAPTVDGGE